MKINQEHARRGSIAYRPDIDGLRAIAVLLVLVFHFHLFSAGKSGFVGVDVFFVISGYLITSIVRQQVAAQQFSLVDFWVKRLRRLAPVLFVVLALVLAYGALRLLQADFKQLAEEVAATQFYVANVYFWRNVNYFGLQAGNIYLLHTWSLSVEEQFYILYPLFLVVVLKRWRAQAPWVVLGVALLSFGLNVAFVGSKPEATFYLMPTRAWELLIGALLTWVPRVRHTGGAHLLGVLGALLIAAAIAAYSPETRFPGVFALLPTLGAASLLLAGGAPGAWSTRVLSMKPVAAIGRISYSLYLVHWPINVFASNELGEGYTLGWRLAMLAVCFVASAILYRWVEMPFRHGRVLSSARGFAQGYGAGLALSIVVCATVITTKGLPQRVPPDVARIAAFAMDRPSERCAEFRAQGGQATPPSCSLGTDGQAPTWVIWGDSHAWAAQDAIDLWLKKTGQAARFAFMNSCPPLRGVHVQRAGTTCHSLNEAMMAAALTDPQIKNVFLVSSWRQAIEGRLSTSPDRHLGEAGSVALFHQRFDATVRELHAGGKAVYLWEPVPGAREDVPRAAALALLRGTKANLDYSAADYREQTAFFFQAKERNRPFIAGSFSPSRVLCQTGMCASIVDGDPVYYDNGHLARSGSARWALALEAQMGQPAVVSRLAN
ncbi:MAG: acyltransferase [Rhizobacter sp.]|nr:acyltransferase [Rhizobacter sp.]